MAYRRKEKVALFCFVICLISLAHEAQGRNVESQLKVLNKPAVKSFKSEHGVIFDCVDIYKQPAFDHPLLKNHTIQTELSSDVKGLFESGTKGAVRTNFGLRAKCPSGTVLIRRTTKEDLLRAGYSDNIYFPQAQGRVNHFAELMFQGTKRGRKYYGAQALMEVHHLNIESYQNSSAHIIVINSLAGPLDVFNTIHFGWNVYPLLNGDYRPHFFTKWTSDAFQKTGCFNMLCVGFVQVSRRMTPGMALEPGNALKLTVYKDNITRNWVLVEGNKNPEMVGYWPADLFNKMDDASVIHIGGTVSTLQGAQSPPMGSGTRPNHNGACKFQQVAIMREPGGAFMAPDEDPDILTDKPQIYGVGGIEDPGGENGYTFEFGGPGFIA